MICDLVFSNVTSILVRRTVLLRKSFAVSSQPVMDLDYSTEMHLATRIRDQNAVRK